MEKHVKCSVPPETFSSHRPDPEEKTKIAWAVWLMIAAGVLVYGNSFSGAFVFDEKGIFEFKKNWLWYSPFFRRPLARLSFMVNYALGGFNVWGYHAVNLAIHISAALTLFGVVRRTFLTQRLRAHYQKAATWLAWVVALVWMVHPLQTQSVTYIAQRAESLMGLFYLLTLYGVIRSTDCGRKGLWFAVAILSCALGMATKEVMVTAPIVILIYDRIFLATSWKEVFTRRGVLYAGLASTWLILTLALLQSPETLRNSAGFSFQRITPLEYALTQPGVILHYLKLSFWPHPLVLDYLWPVVRDLDSIVFPLIPVVLLLGLTAVALYRWPTAGFLGVWFFAILAPTSSIMPVADLAAEQRMYLPLAAVVILAVISVYALWISFCRNALFQKVCRPFLVFAGVGIIVSLLGVLTIQRNKDYRSAERIWLDTIQKRPKNFRAYTNYGKLLQDRGLIQEAVASYQQALAIKPDYKYARNYLGYALAKQGKWDDAIEQHLKAIEVDPNFAEAYNDLALAYFQKADYEKAVFYLGVALQIKPDFSKARKNLEAISKAMAAQAMTSKEINHG